VESNTKQNPSFEESLEQLEKIVDSMESGKVPLEELLAQFEAGTKLLQVCEARLKDAELRIDQLKKTGNSISLPNLIPHQSLTPFHSTL